MILVKTSSAHVDAVRRNRKYATDDPPTKLVAGEEVLVQVTVLLDPAGAPTVRYKMEFVKCYPDTIGESRRLWNEQWDWIVECRNLGVLRRPFDIRCVQVTDKNYGAAQRYAYVEPADIQALMAGGYLVCA